MKTDTSAKRLGNTALVIQISIIVVIILKIKYRQSRCLYTGEKIHKNSNSNNNKKVTANLTNCCELLLLFGTSSKPTRVRRIYNDFSKVICILIFV